MEALGALLIIIGVIVVIAIWTGKVPDVVKAVIG